jgi:tetratricopeptide (TPR) repeat protein
MSQGKTSENELHAMIKRFREMKKEGRILYLDAEQYEDIIDFYIYSKDYKNAVDAIEVAMQIHPDNTRLIATRVAMYIDEGKLEEAREMINKVLDDNALHIRLIHAELLVVEGKKKEAGIILDSFYEEDMDEIDCLDIGLLCSDIGFNEKALYWLKKCLEFNPENEEAMLILCECHQCMGQYEVTIPLYNKLIDKDPYSAEYWSGLGESYFYLGEFDKAVDACDLALVIDDKNGEAYTIKGHACYQLENYQESVEAYKQACHLGSMQPEYAFMFIAFNYIGTEEWDEAYEYIEKAMSHTDENSPVFSDLLINSARCLFYMNKKKEAHRTLEFVQKRFPNNISGSIYNGKFYLKEGNRGKAIINFEKAIVSNPGAETWYQIGLSAMKCGSYDIAKNAFEHVEDIEPCYKNLTEHIVQVTNELFGNREIVLNREALKEHLKTIYPNGVDNLLNISLSIDEYIRKARKEGKSEEEIRELTEALKQLNDILKSFGIGQKEDEIG